MDDCAACIGCFSPSWGPHPFFEAIEKGQVDRVSQLLRQEITLLREVTSRCRLSGWHVASELGQIDVLRELVAAVVETNEVTTMRLSSSLRRMLAIPTSQAALLADFLHMRSRNGLTPLMMAAREGHAAVVEYLLVIGSDPWCADNMGATALHYAAEGGHANVIHPLLKNPPPRSQNAHRGNRTDTKLIEAVDEFGFTPLHYAVLRGHEAAILTLFQYDANMIARSFVLYQQQELLPSGVSPLHIAAARGQLPLVKLILRSYFETAGDLLPSRTALMATNERRRRQRSHPDPRLILTRGGRLPYHLAARAGHQSLLEWLDPSVPLMFLFSSNEETSSSQGGGVVSVGVPRLMVLAATALHEFLMKQLVQAEEDIQEMKLRQQQEEEKRQAAERFAVDSTYKEGSGAIDGLLASLRSKPSVAKKRKDKQKGKKVYRLSILQRVARGVGISRQSSLDSQDDMSRLGITLPSNLEQDPVAIFVNSAAGGGVGLPLLDSRLHLPNHHNFPRARRKSDPGKLQSFRVQAPAAATVAAEGGGGGADAGGRGAGAEQHAQGAAVPAADCESHIDRVAPSSMSVPMGTWPLVRGQYVPPLRPLKTSSKNDKQQSIAASRLRLPGALGSMTIPETPSTATCGPENAVFDADTPCIMGQQPGPAFITTLESCQSTPLAGTSLRHSHSTGSLQMINDDEAGPSHSNDAEEERHSSKPMKLLQTIKNRLHKMSGQVVPRFSLDRGRKQGQDSSAQCSCKPAAAEDASKGAAAAAADGQAGAANAKAEEEKEPCPVCLDELPNISLQTCGHQLCVTCARDLCKRHHLTPALCPYCRALISGFQAVAVLPG